MWEKVIQLEEMENDLDILSICISCNFPHVVNIFSRTHYLLYSFFLQFKIKTLCLVCVMYACIYAFICIFKLELINNFKNSNLLSAFGHSMDMCLQSTPLFSRLRQLQCSKPIETQYDIKNKA